MDDTKNQNTDEANSNYDLEIKPSNETPHEIPLDQLDKNTEQAAPLEPLTEQNLNEPTEPQTPETNTEPAPAAPAPEMSVEPTPEPQNLSDPISETTEPQISNEEQTESHPLNIPPKPEDSYPETEETSEAEEPQETTSSKTKLIKILIAAGTLIVFLGIAYFAYSYFTKEDAPTKTDPPAFVLQEEPIETETEQVQTEENNIESLVQDLQNIFGNQETPPSMSLDIPEEYWLMGEETTELNETEKVFEIDPTPARIPR
jgi:hypothetical protein